MVRGVIEAKPWYPISYVCQLMLTHAFSYLPVQIDGAWKFVPEYSIAGPYEMFRKIVAANDWSL